MPRPKVKTIILSALAVLGVIFGLLNACTGIGTNVQAMFVSREYPEAYHFPTYDKLVRQYVKDDLVDYAALKQSPDLQRAMDEQSRMSPNKLKTNDDVLCYWVNAYNLMVLKSIADAYPITNLKQLKLGLVQRKFIIGGEAMSIQDVFDKQLSPIILGRKEPRLLFLLCGGAMGYAPLLDHAVEPSSLRTDMELSFYKFIMNKKNVRLTKGPRRYYLSPLLQWNYKFFPTDPHDYVSPFLPPHQQIARGDETIIRTFALKFNWTINDTALRPQPPAAGK